MRRTSTSFALLIILLVTFALRVYRLDIQSLWYDEAFSVYLAHLNLADITARTAADIQPPLYYDLLHAWIGVVGDSEFSVRMLSLIFGVLTVPLLWVTARRLFGLGTAYAAALLALLSPLYLWYSQEARMYTLITFLLLFSSYALLRALAAPENKRWWVAFALANIAAAYTHYFALVVIAFQFVYGLGAMARLGRKGSKPLALAAGALVLAFLPWSPFVVTRLGQDASYWQGSLKLDEAIRHIAINYTTGESVLEGQALWIAIGWIALLVAGLVAWALGKRKPGSSGSFLFVLLYLLIPLTALLVLFYRNPKFNARYLMIASPAFFLLLAVGLASLVSLARRRRGPIRDIALALLMILGGFTFATSAYADYNAYFDPAFSKASFREVAQYVGAHIARAEAVLLVSGHMFPAFNYYYDGSAPVVRLPDDPTLNAEHVLDYDASITLNRTLSGATGVWVVLWQDEVVDPNGFVPMLLSSRGKEQSLDGTGFYQVRLRHWTLTPPTAFPSEPSPQYTRVANFKDTVQLLGFDTPNPTPADVGVSFNLYWQSLGAIPDDYQVALRVRDAAGNLWGKQDRRPTGYNYPTMRWKKDEKLFGAYTVPLLAGAPAGNYYVEVTFYTASNPSGLDVLAANGAPVGKTVKLGPIPVLAATKPASYAALGIKNSISQKLGPFTLLGYELGRDKASAGESVPLTLFWRADEKPSRDYNFLVSFGSQPSTMQAMSSAQFPSSTWRAGEIVRGQYNVPIPSDAAAGLYDLKLNMDGGAPGQSVVLARFTVEKTDRTFVQPAVQYSESANFGNAIRLYGYTLDSTLRAGTALKIQLVWQALGKMDKPYTVFVHLLDQNSKVVAQQDTQPVNGARPTNGWVANEFITDNFELALKPDLAPGKYQIEIGWYETPDFTRLQVLDDSGAPVSDRVILKTSVIVP